MIVRWVGAPAGREGGAGKQNDTPLLRTAAEPGALCAGTREGARAMSSDDSDLDEMLLGVTGGGKRKAQAKKKTAKKRRVADSDEVLPAHAVFPRFARESALIATSQGRVAGEPQRDVGGGGRGGRGGRARPCGEEAGAEETVPCPAKPGQIMPQFRGPGLSATLRAPYC